MPIINRSIVRCVQMLVAMIACLLVHAGVADASVSLTTSAATIGSGQSATLTAVSSFDVGSAVPSQFIEIYDQSTGGLVTFCYLGYSCSADVMRDRAGSATYIAYTATDLQSNLPATGVTGTSSTVSVALQAFTISLAESASVVATDGVSTLTATANQPIDRTIYSLAIYDTTTDSLVVACYSGDTCATNVSQTEAGSSSYVAIVTEVAQASFPTSGVVATSGSQSVTMQSFTLRLTSNPIAGSSPAQFRLTTTTNQPLDSTPYFVLVYDRTSKQLVKQCSTGTTCTWDLQTQSSEATSYIAYVAQYGYDLLPPDIQAGSFQVGDWTSVGPTGTDETSGGRNPSEDDSSQRCVCDPFNTRTGDLYESATDLAVPGRGVALTTTRTYAVSHGAQDGRFGYGWSDNYAMRIESNPSGATLSSADYLDVVQENGSRVEFKHTSGNNYTALAREIAKLVRNSDGTFTFTRRGVTKFAFSSTGRLSSEADLNGYTTTLAYDTGGQLTTVTDSASRTLTYGYTGAHVTSVTDPQGRVAAYGYDGFGNLTSATNPALDVTQYDYDAAHRLTTFTDPRGHATTNTYDDLDRLVSQTDPLNHTTSMTYGTDGVNVLTDPRGAQTQYTNVDGELASKVMALGTAQEATWTYTYGSTLGVTQVTDPLSHVWKRTYDSLGNQLTAKDPLLHTWTRTFNTLSEPLTIKDPIGTITTNTYDTAGNLLTTKTPLTGSSPAQTQTTTYGHSDATHPSDVTSITDPRSKVSTYTYTSNGDLASTTDALANETTFTYNSIGWKLTQVSPRGNVTGGTPATYTTTFDHDAMGRLTKTTDPLARHADATYDADGNIATSTDTAGATTTNTWDAANQLTNIARPDSTNLTTTYEPGGNVLTSTDGLTHQTTNAYDILGRLTSVTDPASRTSSYTYDAADRQLTMVDALNRTTTYGYDNANRHTSTSYSDSATHGVTYGYNNDDRRTSMIDAIGTTSYVIDSLGRTTSTTSNAVTTAYGYDLAGNLTTLAYPGSHTVTYTYDDASRPSTIADWLTHTTTLGYDPDGNPTTFTYPNGVVDTNTFDAAGAPTNMTDVKSAATLASFTYGYAATTGLLNTSTTTGVPNSTTETYAYTPLEQVQSVTGGSNAGTFGRNDAEDLTGLRSATLGYDNARQLTSSTPTVGTATTYANNAIGERTSQTTGSSVTGYAYNQAGVLKTYTPPTGSAATYTYDGDGLRATKKLGAATATKQTYTHNGGLPLLLNDATNSYVYTPSGTPIEQVTSSSVITYLHPDALGSTRLITDASGASVGAYTYDAYGTPTHTGTSTTPLQYAGQYTDTESGLQYLRARYYDPTTGQFLSRDPIEAATGDPYGYAGGDPIHNSDPTGMFSASGFISTFAGEADSLTFGGTAWARNHLASATGRTSSVDSCSSEYKAGSLIGIGLSFADGEGEVQAGRLAIQDGRAGAELLSKGFTKDQKALQEIVNDATHGGRKPLTVGDAETVGEWAAESGYPGARASGSDVASPSNWDANPVPHAHLPGAGRGGHVPVEPGTQPW